MASGQTSNAPAPPQFDYLFKIVLVGDSGVGKSNLLSRFTRDVFSVDEKSTIGVEFATRTVTMSDGKRVKAQIWDTAGQERYRAVSTAYYRGALGAMLVYDATKPLTFQNIPRWLREMRDHANKDIVLLMVGNKVDVKLSPQEKDQHDSKTFNGIYGSQESYEGRQVSLEAAEQMAQQLGLPNLETSAMTDFNVEKAFVSVIERIYTALASKQAAAASQNSQNVKSTPSVDVSAQNAAPPNQNTNEKKCCS